VTGIQLGLRLLLLAQQLFRSGTQLGQPLARELEPPSSCSSGRVCSSAATAWEEVSSLVARFVCPSCPSSRSSVACATTTNVTSPPSAPARL
jgi:hypothetical protein